MLWIFVNQTWQTNLNLGNWNQKLNNNFLAMAALLSEVDIWTSDEVDTELNLFQPLEVDMRWSSSSSKLTYSTPWHQHWAETICCQQLSLLAQTLAPSGGEGLESQTKEKKVEENERHFIFSLNFPQCIQMYPKVSQFCWPDSKINDANKRRQCAQETVVSHQLINPFTKTTLFDPIKPPSSISTKDTAAIFTRTK